MITIAMLTNRAIRDHGVDLLGEMQRVLRDYFRSVLDDGLPHGSGVDPHPLGLMNQAAAAGTPPAGAARPPHGSLRRRHRRPGAWSSRR